MKTMWLLIFTLISTNGFAGVGGSVGGSSRIMWGKRLTTLQDFDESLSHIVQWPLVKFLSNSSPVKNVCTNGAVLKTIKPIKVCTKMAVIEVCTRSSTKGSTEECRPVRKGETPKDGFNIKLVLGCVSTTEKNLETSKFYENSICTKWEKDENNKDRWNCIEFGLETKEYADEYDVSVIQNASAHQGGPVEVANLKFEIPQCK
jgi:hypothetical protein